MRELLRSQDAAHEVRFRKTRGQEVLPGRLVAERAVVVVQVKALRGIAQQLPHRGILRHGGPVPGETEGEGCLVVFTDTDRVVQLRQPASEPRGSLALKRRQAREPPLRLRIVPGAQLRGQPQEPCESVGPFERGAARALEVGEFAADVGGGEALRELRACLGGERRRREEPYEPY